MDCSTENKGYKKVPKTQCLRDFLVRWKGLVRSQSLYPAELPAHTNKIYQLIQLLTKYPQVDLVFRSQSLYPAELPARICVALFVL